jgi:hypothetical protein
MLLCILVSSKWVYVIKKKKSLFLIHVKESQSRLDNLNGKHGDHIQMYSIKTIYLL